MSGPLDDPVYRYDRAAAKEHRRNAIDQEKARLLNALKGDPDIAPEDAAPLLDRKNRGNRRSQNKQNNLLNPDDEDYL